MLNVHHECKLGEYGHPLDTKDGDVCKYRCPKCGTDKLTIYVIVGHYSTHAICEPCEIDMEVHSG